MPKKKKSPRCELHPPAWNDWRCPRCRAIQREGDYVWLDTIDRRWICPKCAEELNKEAEDGE